MRGIAIFICGAIVGLLFEVNGIEDGAPGIIALNHVGITVDDMQESVAFYTETLGFEKMFSLSNDEGEERVAYVKIGEDTYLELNRSSGARPAGFTHFGIQVEGMASVFARYQGRGARTIPPRKGGSGVILSYIFDPQGVPIEFAEYPPNWLEEMAVAD